MTDLERLAAAMAVIERQEEALFKIACGSVAGKNLSRANMMDLAEEALPKRLAEKIGQSLHFDPVNLNRTGKLK